MSLETHIAGAEDKLLDSLHCAGKVSASYVTERRSVTFAPHLAESKPLVLVVKEVGKHSAFSPKQKIFLSNIE
jgi:hypothetical protein